MKTIILAGGLGTRLSEETQVRPKPMVEIGGRPLLWHIMKIYGAHGLTDFIVCCGYRGYVIKEWFANYYLHVSDVELDIQKGSMRVLQSGAEPWKITLVDTGEHTMTGGRIKRVRHLLDGDDFCLTYGDGVADIDITALVASHKASGLLATVTAVQPPGRFGAMVLDGERVDHFQEKPQGDGGWINGGFFVLKPAALDSIAGDQTVWEQGPMSRLAADGQMRAWRHDGFWQPVDTLREKRALEELWASGKAPWKVWA